MLFFALYFFLIPGIIVGCRLCDSNIRSGGIPKMAWGLHRSLSPKYKRWALERIKSKRGEELSIRDVSGTEWPVFGSVFYLWATSSLQEAWENDNSLSAKAPKDYARGAVEAATELVIDPSSASWVKKIWGEDYLHRENAFYRMLLIAALTEHYKLTGDDKHLPTLRDQVETLSKEIDESEFGLLDDYPGQCYPTDVLAAIACIRRADAVLGTDHSDFVKRAIRGFQGDLVDELGLPPYSANLWSGIVDIPSRGCGNSYGCWFAPEIWPEQAAAWYDAYEKNFWQHRWSAAGFREFPKNIPGHNWGGGVDSGPILAGHGISACAFGVGAAKMNGRIDHAYPLIAEMHVMSWPLPDGTLALPRILSNTIDAPYLGEAGILFNLICQPNENINIKTGGSIPLFVYIVLFLYFAQAGLMGIFAVRRIRRWRRIENPAICCGKMQLAGWFLLTIAGGVFFLLGGYVVGILLLFSAQALPWVRSRHEPNANSGSGL
jgi:hypothetical protein